MNDNKKATNYMKLVDAAKVFNVSLPTIRRWAEQVDALHKIGGTAMIDVAKINEYIGEH